MKVLWILVLGVSLNATAQDVLGVPTYSPETIFVVPPTPLTPAAYFPTKSWEDAGHKFTVPSDSSIKDWVPLADEMWLAISKQWFGKEIMPAHRISLSFVPNVIAEKAIAATTFDPRKKSIHIRLIEKSHTLQIDLRHEIAHAVFFSRYPQRLPWWIAEGTATKEEDSRREMRLQKVITQLQTERGVSLTYIFGDHHEGAGFTSADSGEPVDTAAYYLQANAHVEFLIYLGGGLAKGKQRFTQLVDKIIDNGNSTPKDWYKNTEIAFHTLYGYKSLTHYQSDWLTWLQSGCPNTPN